jgi:hypothetical protein
VHLFALACISVGVLVVSLRFGSFVAGGSDSYCYVHQAERWASGRLLVSEPLALEAPWPDASLTFAPAGHRPSTTVPGAIVPICPSGLSILMALLLLAGGPAGMFLVIPLCGVALVAATYRVGARVRPRVGLAAALVIASSPIFLYQLIQPMSDVPAAAFWMMAVACLTGTPRAASLMTAGLAASAAILVRPNLLPLGVVIGMYLLCRTGRPLGVRVRDGAVYALWCVPGCLAVAAIQWHFYGSPLASGYGSVDELFAVANVLPNASRYASWLVQSQSPLIVLAVAAPFVWPGGLTWLCLALVAANVGLYLPYVVFEDWPFVRFLLPTIPLLVVLMIGVIDALLDRLDARVASVWLSVATVALVAMAVGVAEEKQVFRLAQLESRFARVGEAVERRLPGNALVITSWYSGSVRFYAGRKTLVWDVLDPAWLDRAIAFARAKGYEPYLLFESGEEPAFRQRFGDSATARLDWPPLLEIAPQVRVYEPSARERYLRGDSVPTEYAR